MHKKKIRLIGLMGVMNRLSNRENGDEESLEAHFARHSVADDDDDDEPSAPARNSEYEMVAMSYREVTGKKMPGGMSAAAARKELAKMFAVPDDEEEEDEVAPPPSAAEPLPPEDSGRDSADLLRTKSILALQAAERGRRGRMRARTVRETARETREKRMKAVGLPTFDDDAMALLQASYREVTGRVMPAGLSPEAAYREINRQMAVVVASDAGAALPAIDIPSRAALGSVPTAGRVGHAAASPAAEGLAWMPPWPKGVRDLFEQTYTALGAGTPSTRAFRTVDSGYAALLSAARTEAIIQFGGAATADADQKQRSRLETISSPAERRAERTRRMTTQAKVPTLILPRVTAESEDAFDARLEAVEASARLARATKAPTPLVFPQQPRETLLAATARFAAQKGSAAPILPLGTYEEMSANAEKPGSFELRLAAAQKQGSTSRVPIIPKGRFESDVGFEMRIGLAGRVETFVLPQPKAETNSDAILRLRMQKMVPAASIPPFSPTNETRDEYSRRVRAMRGSMRGSVRGSVRVSISGAGASTLGRFSTRVSQKLGVASRRVSRADFANKDARNSKGAPVGYVDSGIWRPPDRTLKLEGDDDDVWLLGRTPRGCLCCC